MRYATGFTYQWLDCDNGNSPVPGATNQTFTPSSSGNFAVEILHGQCSVLSTCTNVTVVNQKLIAGNEEFEIYPNPTKQNLFVKNPFGTQANIQIIDYLGRNIEWIQSVETITLIDLKHLASGTYWVIVSDKNQQEIQKLIKQ